MLKLRKTKRSEALASSASERLKYKLLHLRVLKEKILGELLDVLNEIKAVEEELNELA